MRIPQPPKGRLSAESRRWWRRVLTDYDLDAAGQLLLCTTLQALDRMRQAQRALKADGAYVKDRFGQKRAHPALQVGKDARGQLLAGFKALNLDLEPLKDGPGRPAGTGGGY